MQYRASASITSPGRKPSSKERTNPSSPDRSHLHVLRQGETLGSIAWRYHLRTDSWRDIAVANGIEDPRRMAPGRLLEVPAIIAEERRA